MAPLLPGQNTPSLMGLAAAFARISLSSFGGGNSAWIRRELVERRGWLTPEDFLAGFGVSLIMPGATAVNLAIFCGTKLRGTAGALAAGFGIVVPPMLIVLALGILYASVADNPQVRHVLAGLGAAAAGLTLRMGITSARDGIKDWPEWLGTVIVAIVVGVLGWPILPVIAVMAPIHIGIAYVRSPP